MAINQRLIPKKTIGLMQFLTEKVRGGTMQYKSKMKKKNSFLWKHLKPSKAFMPQELNYWQKAEPAGSTSLRR